jgi:hypothetical protein
MRSRVEIFFALLACASGCKSKPDVTPAPTPIASSSAAAATASVATTTTDAGAPLTEDEKKEHALFVAAMAKGRAAVARHDYFTAARAFDDAVKHAPHDARPLGERGYVKYLSNDMKGARTDLEAARDLGASPKTMAAIWFNLGLLREREGDAERARAAFANSESISHSKAAEDKIAGLSSCTADIGAGTSDLQKAANWLETASLLQIDPTPPNEKIAKDAVCIFSSTADGSGDAHGVCDTAPPWLVAHDHLLYFARAHVLYPAQSKDWKLFVDDVGQVGSWPAHCTGETDASGKIVGQYGWTTRTFDGKNGVMFAPGDDTSSAVNLTDMGDCQCGDAPGSIDDTFYDLKTGSVLLDVHRTVAIGASAPLVKLEVTGTTIHITENGCNSTIDLATLHGGNADAGKK